MLVAVVVLFVVTELPQGALALCSGLVEHCFQSYYSPLGDTMDIVALINNGINFALYCTMSARFRQTFARLISPFRPVVVARPTRCRRRRHEDPGGCGQRDGSHHGEMEDGDGVVSRPVSADGRGSATCHMMINIHKHEAHEQLEISVIDQR